MGCLHFSGLPACVTDPAVEKHINQRVDEEVETRLENIEAQKLEQRRKDKEGGRELVKRFFGTNEQESKWMLDYVCTVRQLRADLLDEVRQGKIDLSQASERQKVEREALLGDLERLLGPERYARLREVGGLGKLPDLVECD